MPAPIRPVATRLRRLALAGLAIAAVAAAADAQDCGPYRVGLREYPQLYERGAGGAHEGLDKDFFAALAERSGCRFSLHLESQPRLWRRLQDGTLDIASWVVVTAERQSLVSVIPLLSSRQMAVLWREQGAPSQAEFEADPNLRAVAIRKASHGPGYDALLERLRTQGRLSEVADFETALRAFTGRRAELLLASPWSLAGQPRSLLEQLRFLDWQAGAPALSSGLALSHRTVRARDRLRLHQALHAMQQDGSLARIVGRHLPPDGVQLLAVPEPR